MKLREKAAKAIDELMGEEVSVENLSIRELIDTFEKFGTEVAMDAYMAGNDDGADGRNRFDNYRKTLK